MNGNSRLTFDRYNGSHDMSSSITVSFFERVINLYGIQKKKLKKKTFDNAFIHDEAEPMFITERAKQIITTVVPHVPMIGNIIYCKSFLKNYCNL